jgi:hypothetical protein
MKKNIISRPIFKITLGTIGLLFLMIFIYYLKDKKAPDEFSNKIFTLKPFDTTFQKTAFSETPFPKVAADIRLKLELNDDLAGYHGTQVIHYINTQQVPFNSIGFYLYPNFVKGKLEAKQVLLQGRKAIFSVDDSILTIQLPRLLQPSEQLTIQIEFTGVLPDKCYGVAALCSDGQTFYMGGGYPEIIPHKTDGSWEAMPPMRHGDPPENPLAIYSVVLKASPGLKIASTGTLKKGKTEGNQQEYQMVSGPVRDFIVAGSTDWEKVTMQKHGTIINVFYPSNNIQTAILGAYTTADALSIFGKQFGPYPYTEIDLVGLKFDAVRIGMEYPGVLVVLDKVYEPSGVWGGYNTDFAMEFVATEEVAHQWFYNIYGNDTFKEPWIDESFAHYAIWSYYDQKYGKTRGDWLYSIFENRWKRSKRSKIPLNTPTDKMDGNQFYSIMQGRAVLFLFRLEILFGKEQFQNLMNYYLDNYRWRRISSLELQSLVSRFLGAEAEKRYQEWVFGVSNG